MRDLSTDGPSSIYSERLSTNIYFENYSDAKLVRLYLDNDFPISLFEQVFDLVRDPGFKPDEITFRNIWHMFEDISTRRRRNAVNNDLVTRPIPQQVVEAWQPKLPDYTEPERIVQAPRNIPPVVLSLVADYIMEGQVPFGDAAMENNPSNASSSNGKDLRNMSLVHRSWTLPAQRGLRRRAVVPCRRIREFFYSPLCGPWVVEMIVYWNVDGGATQDDMRLLGELLRRIPNLRSLSLNTYLLWKQNEDSLPDLNVAACFDLISSRLLNLENLWLKNRQGQWGEESIRSVREGMYTLCLQLPKMPSLRFLSTRGWGFEDGETPLDWNEHPPSGLKAIELNLQWSDVGGQALTWLFRPRGDTSYPSLSVVLSEGTSSGWSAATSQALGDCLRVITSLRLCIIYDNFGQSIRSHGYANLLRLNTTLTSLDLFIMTFWTDRSQYDLGSLVLPSSLERLAIHCFNSALRIFFPRLLRDIAKHLSALPHLRNLLIIASKALLNDNFFVWDGDGLMRHMSENAKPLPVEKIPKALVRLCTERNVELTCLSNHSP